MFRFLFLQTNLITLHHIWSVKKWNEFLSLPQISAKGSLPKISTKDWRWRILLRINWLFFHPINVGRSNPFRTFSLTFYLPFDTVKQRYLLQYFTKIFDFSISILLSYFCQILFYLLRIIFGPLLKWYHIWEIRCFTK
jgi:hypothetical protein